MTPREQHTGQMMAISLWQPWATLCVIGEKRFETRHWPTSFRGPLLIHASKRANKLEQKDLLETRVFRESLQRGGYDRWEDLPLGALVGRVELVECGHVEDCAGAGDKEQAFGNYEPGRWAWLLKNPQRFIVPIPYTGRQGFFLVPEGVLIQGAPHREIGAQHTQESK